MKRILTLTAILLACWSSSLSANEFATLAGAGDKVTIARGQTAIVLYVTEAPTVQYTKRNRRPVQFQLGLTRHSNRGFISGGRHAYSPQVERNPSTRQPLALAGPAVLSLQTPGVISLQIIGDTKN